MWAVEFRLGEIRRRLAQNLIRPTQLTVLLLELLHPFGLLPRRPGSEALIDISLLDPRADGLDAIPELLGHTLHRPMLLTGLGADLAHQPDRLLLLRSAIPTRRRPLR